jgi:hypothetical protein
MKLHCVYIPHILDPFISCRVPGVQVSLLRHTHHDPLPSQAEPLVFQASAIVSPKSGDKQTQKVCLFLPILLCVDREVGGRIWIVTLFPTKSYEVVNSPKIKTEFIWWAAKKNKDPLCLVFYNDLYDGGNERRGKNCSVDKNCSGIH